MVATGEIKRTLWDNSWAEFSLPAACANRSRAIPNSGDTFAVQRSPHQGELARLTVALSRASADEATRQAAVWIETDDANYSDLGTLVTRPANSAFGGNRAIHEIETARAMKICDEAGIDVTGKRIWRDKRKVLEGLDDEDLRKWLEEKQ